jgi:GH43 family beta-xylosidase
MTRHLAYQNPVFAHDFADPFVLKFCGEYWAYGTGYQPDGRVFGVLRSRDLIHWQALGGAMAPLPGNFPCYWAPEVTYAGGHFYLYYSVGDEATMHIRVATSDHPAGPFIDQGARLTAEPFAIDGHVFTTPEGRRYFFYATDFLDHERVGTGTVVDEMLDLTTLAGHPRPVSRARYDWQIYDPQRAEKGGACWHTIEGPFVLERKGTYYQMFSGGNWQNPSYGVSYATADGLDAGEEWHQMCDGEQVLPILRTVAGRIIGPGHNSVVRGPDNRQLVCVYHRWGSGEGRQLAIDPLEWAGERMLALGPTDTPQVGLPRPTFADFFDDPEANAAWQASGRWQFSGEALALPGSAGPALLSLATAGRPFLAEVSARAAGDGRGAYGLGLFQDETLLSRLTLSPGAAGAAAGESFPLPPDFRFDVFHLMRVEVDGRRVALRVDDGPTEFHDLAGTPNRIALLAEGSPAAFAGFALSAGWQDEFDHPAGAPHVEWVSDHLSSWTIQARELTYQGQGESLLWREPFLDAYDLVVNARLVDSRGVYGITPALAPGGHGPLLTIKRAAEGWAACANATGHQADGRLVYPLPATFDPFAYQQFRFRKEAGHLTIFWEQHAIAELSLAPQPTAVGLFARGKVTFDMVRVTAVPLSTLIPPSSETTWKPTTPSFGPPA